MITESVLNVMFISILDNLGDSLNSLIRLKGPIGGGLLNVIVIEQATVKTIFQTVVPILIYAHLRIISWLQKSYDTTTFSL